MAKKLQSLKISECLLTAPSLLWLIVFFIVPSIAILAITFKPTDPFGGVGEGWTSKTLFSLAQPNYPIIIWRTIWLSFLTTLFSVILAIPTGYYIARLRKDWQRYALLLVIVPFWTSFLVRIFAWKTLLHPEGFVKHTLMSLGLVSSQTSLLYNSGAVLLVMIYTFLPFAILPIYAATEKFNFSLMEAARDLGATKLQSFCRVFLPGISQGLLTAILMVFIPALGSYVIPDVVGGPGGEMIGNKIAQRVFVDRNLPHASGLSAFLTLAVIIPTLWILILQQRKGKGKNNAPLIEEDA